MTDEDKSLGADSPVDNIVTGFFDIKLLKSEIKRHTGKAIVASGLLGFVSDFLSTLGAYSLWFAIGSLLIAVGSMLISKISQTLQPFCRRCLL